MDANFFYLAMLTVHLFCVSTWLGGNVFFIGFVALTRKENFLKNIRARLIFTYAISFRKMTYVLFAAILLSGMGLIYAHGWLNASLFILPAAKIALWKLSIFSAMGILQLVHDFLIGPRSYHIDGDEIRVKEEYRSVNRLVGYTVFLITLTLFMLGILLSRRAIG